MITATLLLASVTISLPAKAESRGTEVELGELAQIQCDDAALAQKFESFGLGYAPAPGFSRLFEASRLIGQLEANFPGIEIRFAGEAQCRIHPETEVILGADLAAIGREQITELAAGQDVEFDPSGVINDIIVPAGKEGAKLRLRRGPIHLRSGKNSIPIEVLVDGQAYQTVWTTWDVRMWESVLVLTRDVAAGDLLTPESVEYRRVRSERAASQAGIRREALIATRAARALTSGSVLGRNDILQLELIRRGDSIVLEVKKGNVLASVAAVASEDGYLGKRIRVITSDTKRELTGVVVSRGRVQIDMTSTN